MPELERPLEIGDIVIPSYPSDEAKAYVGWSESMSRCLDQLAKVISTRLDSPVPYAMIVCDTPAGLLSYYWPVSALTFATPEQVAALKVRLHRETVRKQAKASLSRKMEAWDDRPSRCRLGRYRTDRARFLQYQPIVYAAIKNPSSWEHAHRLRSEVESTIWMNLPNVQLTKAIDNYAYPDGRDYSSIVWRHEDWWTTSSCVGQHWAHVAENPALIAYYQSADKFLRQIATPIKPGAYLRKYFGSVLDEATIKKWADRQVMSQVPPEVHFVENDDPDKWVEVYESGVGFTSCMVYDRPGRYLEEGLCGENHPVRSYCYPGNGLRLAWLGKKYPDGSIEVAARTIVHEADGEKAYVRIYGDERLYTLLRNMGYDNDPNLEGVKLQARKHPTRDGCWIVPYLDGSATMWKLADDLSCIIRMEDGPFGCSSAGWNEASLERQERWENDDDDDDDYYTCEDCGERVHVDNIQNVGYHGDRMVCDSCLDNYTYVIGRNRANYYVPNNDAVYCESDDQDYDADWLDTNDVARCEMTDKYYKLDVLVHTSIGMVHIDKAVKLDVEDEDGNDYAGPSEAVTLADGRKVHEDMAAKDAVTGEYVLMSEVLSFTVQRPGGRHYISEYHTSADSVKENPEMFSVIGDYLYLGRPERGALSLTEWIATEYDGTNTLMNCSDGDEDEWESVFDEMQYDMEEHAEVAAPEPVAPVVGVFYHTGIDHDERAFALAA